MPRLRVISFNDVYTLENLPRLATLLRHYREVDPADALLVIVAGDFLAPSILSSLDGGAGMVACLNVLGVTHVTFGNHEDDVDVRELRARVAGLRATWLATNVCGFRPELTRSDVVTAGGVRVGLVGVVMDDPSVYRRAPFGAEGLRNPNDAALEEMRRLLRDEGCRYVLPITHQELDADRALAHLGEHLPMPVIVGGHEHTVVLEQRASSWIVKAGCDAEHAVVTDLSIDLAGAPGVQVRVALDDSARYPEDLALRAQVDATMRKVHALEEAALVTVSPGELLSSVGARSRQTTLGTVVCSSLRDALDAEACLFNGGGIRGARAYEGRFTYADLRNELPFDNEIVVASVPGRVVQEAVAASRARAPAESGGFLQVDDRTLVSATTHHLTQLAGEPLADARNYRVALVREMLFGLDHNEPLVRFARDSPERVPPEGSGREVKTILVDAFSRTLWGELGAFEAIDADHDGVVTKDEVEAAVLRRQGVASPLLATLLVHALDANGDERISQDEDAAARKKTPR